MNLQFAPSRLEGRVTVPSSKSEAHRLLVCAALCDGESVLHSLPCGDDVAATLGGLASLGASFSFAGDTVTVRGLSRGDGSPATVNCSESGATLRFLLPLALALGRETLFCGSERLFSRPLDGFAPLCEKFELKNNRLLVKGTLPQTVSVDASRSSQPAGGFLMAYAFLGGGRVRLVGEPVSRPYLDETVAVLSLFGCRVTEESGVFTVHNGLSPAEVTAEGDFSSAAVWLAANALGARIAVEGLPSFSVQADRAAETLFPLLDGSPVLSVRDCPDLFLSLSAVAAAKNGAVFTDTDRLRFKESDRIAAMQTELAKFGARLSVEADRVTVVPPVGGLQEPSKPLFSHNDHRVAMALSLLCCLTGGVLCGAECVSKSYPDFFRHLRSLGGSYKERRDID